MTVLDIILIAVLVWAVYSGAKKGFFVQLGGIVGIVLGIWLAFRFSGSVGEWLGIEGGIAWYVGFALIVLACILAIGILGWLAGKVFHLVGLGFLNRLGGVVLSLAKAVPDPRGAVDGFSGNQPECSYCGRQTVRKFAALRADRSDDSGRGVPVPEKGGRYDRLFRGELNGCPNS